jgi:hypothetical protein
MFHNTLNAALAARDESLIELWPLGLNISYNQTAMAVVNGVYISVYRDKRGMYEEAISYASKCEDFQKVVDMI